MSASGVCVESQKQSYRAVTASTKKAFVTGHKGFVGRHLIPKLHKAGYDVAGTEDFARYGPFATDLAYWMKALDVVIHLGANIVNVHERGRLGMKAFDDIILDNEVCKYVEEIRPKTFIVMSSCAVDYPDDPYCIVKRTLEGFALALHKQGIRVPILRPFSGYGSDQSQEYPFPAILKRAIARQEPLEVWGGSQVRDWLHIDDLTDAIMWAINGAPSGRPIEIGTGIGTSLHDLAVAIAAGVGYEPKIFHNETKATSSPRRVADPSFAESLGWKARISLAEGIHRSLKELGLGLDK